MASEARRDASSDAHEARSRLYYDRIAAQYDQMVETPGNRAIRDCFWQCADKLFPAPARLLDFGAGTGVDAEHFARLGHKLFAFEHSDGMAIQLRRRCAEQISSGSVTLVAGPLAAVRDQLLANAPFDGILCNFAVLSTVARLRPLFDLFAEITRPGASVLISIQNPWHPPTLTNRTFWKSLLAWPFTGKMSLPSPEQGRIYFHSAAQLRRAARHGFVRDYRPPPPCRAAQFGWRSPFNLVSLRRA